MNEMGRPAKSKPHVNATARTEPDAPASRGPAIPDPQRELPPYDLQGPLAGSFDDFFARAMKDYFEHEND